MYEKRSDEVISQKAFIWRLIWHVLAALLLVVITLFIGALGHVYFENVQIHDALVNSAMLMGGVGTTILPESVAGKMFFSAYGLFLGILFAAVVGVVLAPLIHRIVHKMHLDDDED